MEMDYKSHKAVSDMLNELMKFYKESKGICCKFKEKDPEMYKRWDDAWRGLSNLVLATQYCDKFKGKHLE